MDQKTYTKRTNARRAGMQAGLPRELIEITVQKSPEGVRFGWRAGAKSESAVTLITTQAIPLESVSDERNGVRRPKAGGLCAAVWEWLDANPIATLKGAKVEGETRGWNPNNVSCEFYAWRKFSGVSRRTT